MACGTLYVVATPIGNLGDLTPRAGEVLRAVHAVVAEDTRRTRKLFAHLGTAPPPLLSLPAFDERGRVEPLVQRLRAGQDLALCTDAGTPGVADPGRLLVDAAWEAGARVVPVPGPSAALAALSASGLASDRFLVLGFLPRKGAGRAAAVAEMSRSTATVVLFEAGNRAGDTLAELAAALGGRRAVLARELTKLHEELARGSLSELASRFAGEVRGEVTLVIEGADEAAPRSAASREAVSQEGLEEELRRRMAAGEAPTAIARQVAQERGLPRREIYAQLTRLKSSGR